MTSVRDALREAGIDSTVVTVFGTGQWPRREWRTTLPTLGRWESVAYLQYIKLQREQLVGYSGLLASPYPPIPPPPRPWQILLEPLPIFLFFFSSVINLFFNYAGIDSEKDSHNIHSIHVINT